MIVHSFITSGLLFHLFLPDQPTSLPRCFPEPPKPPHKPPEMLPRTSQTLLLNFPDLVFLPLFNTCVCPRYQIRYQLIKRAREKVLENEEEEKRERRNERSRQNCSDRAWGGELLRTKLPEAAPPPSPPKNEGNHYRSKFHNRKATLLN